MAFEQDGQTYYDTKPAGENNTTVNYIDPTDLPEIDDEIKNGIVGNVEQGIASWIRNEMGRKHVREALARSVEYFSALFNKLEVIIDSNTAKQNNVEQRQSKLERDFITRISNATVNSEVINARQSDIYGQFNILDLRVENIEKIMANFVPSGFIVKINHNLNRNPTVTVKKYDWAIGTETDGFDTAPNGLFGGGAVETVPTNLIYASGVVYVHMPLVYKQGGNFILQSDKELLLIDGTHTLNFEFEGGLTDVTIPDEPINNIPINHTAYAYSADGMDRFTTVYPSLNLLDGTKDFSGDWTNLSSWVTNGTYKNLTVKTQNVPWAPISKKNTVSTPGTYTISEYVRNTGSSQVTSSLILNGSVVDAKDNGTHFDWKVVSFTRKLSKGDTISLETHNGTAGQISVAGYKVEPGSTATQWMPSANEVTTADWPSYFGQYTDFTKVDSKNPSDYHWSPIPR